MTEQNTPQRDIGAFKALLEIDEKERNAKDQEGYLRAYVFSAILPPIGVYYLFKYIFFGSGRSDDVKAGIISFLVTLLSLLLSFWLFSSLFTTTIPTQQGNDFLKDLITPAHQKELNELLR